MIDWFSFFLGMGCCMLILEFAIALWSPPGRGRGA